MLTVLMKIVHYWDFRPVLLCSHVKVWRQFEPQLANRRQAARGFSFHIPRRGFIGRGQIGFNWQLSPYGLRGLRPAGRSR